MGKQETKVLHDGAYILAKRKDSVGRITTFLVFDIETVPDTEMVEVVGKDKEKEKLQCMRAGQNGEPVAQGAFLQPHFHQIVAVSTLVIKPSGDGAFSLDLASAHGSEMELIKHFWLRFREAMLYEVRPQNVINILGFPCLVSFNGTRFDMPAIVARTLKYARHLDPLERGRVALYCDNYDKWEDKAANYRNRYTKYHVDLCWEIMDGSNTPISLAAACYLAGIPVKTGMGGKDVWKAHHEGKHQEIAEYCAEDVMATAQLFSIWNEVFLGGRFNFPTREKLSGLEPKIIKISK
ncbi:MAG: hypothetical protein WHS86_15920 [Desulfosoma sp.]